MKQLTLLGLMISALVMAERGPVPTLIGGNPADPAKWPFVVWLKMNGGLCTATVVGDRAVITAAHCVNTNEKAKFTAGGKEYTATFTRHPKYPKNDWDVSLGITDEKINVKPATISGQVAVGDMVHLMGFGCTQQGGGGGNDGVLREGDSKVIQLATYDIVMKSNVALCFGDSGGPAFSVKDGKVSQVGVNSKGNISDTSYDTKLWEAEVQNFIKDWSKKTDALVCGVTQNCDVIDPPPGDKKFNLSNKVVDIQGTVKTSVDLEYVKNVFGDAMRFLEKEAQQ